MKVLISGGGTGGHVFPAIAIADALTGIESSTEILFVGAKGKMEMTKVPEAGYKIIGLPIRGFNRKLSLQNFLLPFYLLKSLWTSWSIIRNFKPDIVVGVGGYASGAILKMASWFKKPIVIQEQNSYPGITNRLMAKAAVKIFVAFDGLENYFDKHKIVVSGNPLRNSLNENVDSSVAKQYFGLNPLTKTVGVFGGSLGAKSINESILTIIDSLKAENIQLIWQTGNLYFQSITSDARVHDKRFKILGFVDRMDLAYSACDLIISRAGALTLSELCLRSKPAILIPSPNVVEDHQRKNAEAMVKVNAARMILDADSHLQLWSQIKQLLYNESVLTEMKLNLARLAKPNAANHIANEIILIANNRKQKLNV